MAGIYGSGYGYGFDGYGGNFGFLNSLSPGIPLVLQYDFQPPAFGTFQGFQDGLVLISNYNGFPGVVRIPIGLVNAISPWGGGLGGFGSLY